MERLTTVLSYGVILALALTLLVSARQTKKRDKSHTLAEARDTDAQHDPKILPIREAASDGDRFAVTVRHPEGPPVIELTTPDPHGRQGSIACSTCHSVREPDFNNRSPKDLDQFHQNMPMNHGTIACYSCHHPSDSDTLRLADGTAVDYVDVMTLCAQCHGSQARDYEHGAHGGMNGYWDLSRGPRTRNNCIDCHDPHVPEFPSMQPTFKPRDRFLVPHADSSHPSVREVDHE